MSYDLKIRLCQQPNNTNFCGPYCMKMVLKYFGMRVRMQAIKEYCKCSLGGTLDTSIALGLRKIGLDAMMYTLPTGGVIRGKYADMSNEKVAESLRKRVGKVKITDDTDVETRHFCRWMQETAELAKQDAINYQLPTREIIQAELDKGNPWIVTVKAYMLYDWKDDKDKGHFVVIRGYDDDCFIINDPIPGEQGGVKRIQKDLLLCAIYNWTANAVNAVCIRRKSR